MGAFFNNIQVKSTDGDTNALREQIIKTITLLHIQNDYELIEKEDNADKSVIVAFSNETPWIAVYDEETIMNLDVLNNLGLKLSKEQETIALTVLVGDSDYVSLGYNKNGKLEDSISNFSDLVSLETSKPEIWADLTYRKSFEDIESAWNNKTVFIESFLEEFGKLLNISSNHLLAGYYDINEDISSFGTILHFAKKKKEEQNTNDEPVNLNMLTREGFTDFKINSTTKIKWMITNFGESSIGLDIMFAGDAVEHLCVKPLTAKISHHKQDENRKEYLCEFTETIATTGERLFHINIEDFYIPKGARPIPSIKIKKWQDDTAILYDAAINMDIEFLPLKACKTELKLFVVPLTNRQGGSHYESLELTIKE